MARLPARDKFRATILATARLYRIKPILQIFQKTQFLKNEE